MDIGVWLRSLGLEEYEAAFRDNAIDAEVLHDMTDQDLNNLGVLLGHRRKLLRAIAALDGSAATATPAPLQGKPPAAPVHALPKPPARPRPTRRRPPSCHGDVLRSRGFDRDCREARRGGVARPVWRLPRGDVGGGNGDGRKPQPKALAQGGRRAGRRAHGAVRLSGRARKTTPSARPAPLWRSNARRAIESRERCSGKPALAARVAIDWGPWWSKPARFSATCLTSQPARRLPPGRARSWCGAGCGRSPACSSPRSAAVTEVSGVPEPVTLFRLVRASGVRRRAGQRRLTPLVGRDEELAMLLRRWERARRGDGQLVLIIGEPGLGKSRLMEEFRTRLRDTPHTWVDRGL